MKKIVALLVVLFLALGVGLISPSARWQAALALGKLDHNVNAQLGAIGPAFDPGSSISKLLGEIWWEWNGVLESQDAIDQARNDIAYAIRKKRHSNTLLGIIQWSNAERAARIKKARTEVELRRDKRCLLSKHPAKIHAEFRRMSETLARLKAQGPWWVSLLPAQLDSSTGPRAMFGISRSNWNKMPTYWQTDTWVKDVADFERTGHMVSAGMMSFGKLNRDLLDNPPLSDEPVFCR